MTPPASPPRLRTVTATVIGILAAVAAALALALPATAAGTNHATQGNAGTSGNPKSPQPVSNADQNSGGANGQCPSGPYCSTRDGSASGNGNGGGKAVGKPCAGCVGKADNKNPQGQMPNGSDHNAGYECDRNHGIGRTNPAHTGCTTSAPTTATPTPTETPTVMPTASPTETPTGTPTGTPTVMPTETESGQSAPAQSTPAPTTTACVPTAANGFCATVLGEKQTKTPPSTIVPPAVSGEQVVRTPSSGLPFTGAAIATLVLVAALALVGGSLLAMVARRRRRT